MKIYKKKKYNLKLWAMAAKFHVSEILCDITSKIKERLLSRGIYRHY